MSTSEKTFYRVVERNGETVIVDLDGKLVTPHEMKRLAKHVIETVEREMYVYVGTRKSDGLTKIGMTGNVDRRAKELDIEIVKVIECERFGKYSAAAVEKRLHELAEVWGARVEGEWFDLSFPDHGIICWLTAHEVIDNGAEMLESSRQIFEQMPKSHEKLLACIMEMVTTSDVKRRAIGHYLHKLTYACADGSSVTRNQNLSLALVAGLIRLSREASDTGYLYDYDDSLEATLTD